MFLLLYCHLLTAAEQKQNSDTETENGQNQHRNPSCRINEDGLVYLLIHVLSLCVCVCVFR